MITAKPITSCHMNHVRVTMGMLSFVESRFELRTHFLFIAVPVASRWSQFSLL